MLTWFTVKEDVGHVYAAFSSDTGRTFGAPIRLDDLSAIGRADVASLQDGSALAHVDRIRQSEHCRSQCAGS